MAVTCDLCGIPTDEPSLTADNRYLCEECKLLCKKCEGNGCDACSGSGLDPEFDPDVDTFGGGF